MAGNDGNPFLGVPQGNVRVENPDGVFLARDDHSLYDRDLKLPQIPGNYDLNCDVPMSPGVGYK